jgi:hypothetical protein
VLPGARFGTGLAKLDNRDSSAKTFAFPQAQVQRIKTAFPLATAEAPAPGQARVSAGKGGGKRGASKSHA